MLQFKIDVLKLLKRKGYNTTRLRTERIIGESAIQKLRTGEIPSTKIINKLCELLEMQPGDLLKYVPENK